MLSKVRSDRTRRLALVVCSNGKSPILLESLASLACQQPDHGWIIDSRIIVWNGDQADIEKGKQLLAASPLSTSLSVIEVFEPKRGIPLARNRGLEEAKNRGVDWLFFMDDDCVANSDLVIRLTECARDEDAQVVAGGWEIVASGQTSTWLPKRVLGRKHYEVAGASSINREVLPTAYTRNVLFDLSFLGKLPNEARRFDERLAQTGDSDTRFFFRISRNGGKIVYAEHAMVSENYPKSRLSLCWHMRRRIRNAQRKFLRASETGEKLFAHQLP